MRTFPSTRGIHPATCTDRGIFGIGNPKADELALQWALSHVPTGADGVKVVGEVGQKMGCAVVIFGTGIDALAAVGGLIRGGVPASLIILVTPEIELKGLGHSSVCYSTLFFFCRARAKYEKCAYNKCY